MMFTEEFFCKGGKPKQAETGVGGLWLARRRRTWPYVDLKEKVSSGLSLLFLGNFYPSLAKITSCIEPLSSQSPDITCLHPLS